MSWTTSQNVTAPKLLRVGFEQKPMLYTQKHLEDALHPKTEDNPHYHGLSIETMKRLPELLEEPVLMADSPARNDSIVVALNAVDEDGLPIICAIKPDGKGYYDIGNIETNMILAVYGKNEFERYFSDRITEDRIFFFNKERGHELERLAGIQFPEYYFSRDLSSIVREPVCVSMRKQEERTEPTKRVSSVEELAARGKQKAEEHNKNLKNTEVKSAKKGQIR